MKIFSLGFLAAILTFASTAQSRSVVYKLGKAGLNCKQVCRQAGGRWSDYTGEWIMGKSGTHVACWNMIYLLAPNLKSSAQKPINHAGTKGAGLGCGVRVGGASKQAYRWTAGRVNGTARHAKVRRVCGCVKR